MKRYIRELLKQYLPSATDPIIVASMGRSGSTLVYEALCEGMLRARFRFAHERLRGLVRDTAWNLAEANFRNGRIYKTHDFARHLNANPKLKAVFLFGSASAAARSVINCRSTYGDNWIASHFRHLAAKGELSEVPHKDVLRFQEQLDSWLENDRVPTLSLRYEDLWLPESLAELSKFVGFEVKFPARRARESSQANLGDSEGEIQRTYHQLDQRILSLPSIIPNELAQKYLTTISKKI